MTITIRKAEKNDCVSIMELVRELAIYEKEPDAVTVTMDHFIESGFGENPVWEAFVAIEASPNSFGRGEQAKIVEETEANSVEMINTDFIKISSQQVIGFALYYTRYSTWKGQRMYLEDFYVTEKMRGTGTGKLLFDKLMEECKAKKYSGLVWQVLDWNEPAINFYKKYEGVKFDGEWLNCSMEF
jgi:L-amino acid N-acyltransferase YncA